MSMNGLAKQYGKLSARERFVLMEAAELRDDQSELQRLEAAAQRRVYEIADYTPFTDSWRSLEMAFLADMMYECASFWQAFYLATRHDDGDHMPDLLFALAYRAITLFGGWARFCEGVQIEPPGNIQEYGGWSFITDTIETARAFAFTEEQMRGWLAEQHNIAVDRIATISNAESKAAQYADAYAHLLRQWGKTP